MQTGRRSPVVLQVDPKATVKVDQLRVNMPPKNKPHVWTSHQSLALSREVGMNLIVYCISITGSI